MTDIANRLTPRTDKFTLGYFPAYERMAGIIGPAGHILEVGVYQGGSLMMWQELFPDGLIAGADNDAEGPAVWPDGTVPIRAAQDNVALPVLAREASPDGYDLIVDDASHIGALSAVTFRLLWPLVKPGRWYVLEDWTVGLVEPWVRSFGDSMLRLAESFLILLGPGGDVDSIEYRFGQAILHKREVTS